MVTATTRIFPSVFGRTMQYRWHRIPGELKGDVNLLLVAFSEEANDCGESWLPVLDQLEAKYEAFAYYECPIITNTLRSERAFLAFSRHTPHVWPEAEEKILMLYANKHALRKQLGVNHTVSCLAVLVSSQGKILWASTETCRPGVFRKLAREVYFQLVIERL